MHNDEDNKWNEYIDDRLIMKKHNYYIIKPKNQKDVIPLSCEICDNLFKDNSDEIAYNKFKCCDACANKWAYPNGDKWLNGWRPDKKEIDLEIKNRPLRHIKII